jgi:hypothetical protein
VGEKANGLHQSCADRHRWGQLLQKQQSLSNEGMSIMCIMQIIVIIVS